MENMQKDSETISLKKIIVDYLYHWKVFFSCSLYFIGLRNTIYGALSSNL